ncbi:hypothetical protein GCM10028791_00800 [Echinicola sediminis]
MDFLTLIEASHSKSNTAIIVDDIGEDEKKFADLFRIFMKGPYRITQRAAWPLSLIVERHPALLMPYYKEIIYMLKKPGEHDAVRRNLLRVLQDQQIPSAYEGEILELGFEFLQDKQQPIAIRVFAMQVVYNLSDSYPEIKPELKVIIEDMLPYASAGIKSRARKLLAKLNKGHRDSL